LQILNFATIFISRILKLTEIYKYTRPNKMEVWIAFNFYNLLNQYKLQV